MVAPAADRDVLAAIFASRLSLCQKTEAEAAAEAVLLRRQAVMWISSNSQRKYSFMWFCDMLDVEPGAVRKVVRIEKENSDADND